MTINHFRNHSRAIIVPMRALEVAAAPPPAAAGCRGGPGVPPGWIPRPRQPCTPSSPRQGGSLRRAEKTQ